MSGKIFLKRGKEKPLRHHHPWIFSGAIQRVENANDGDTVDVFDAGGEWLARAAYNARSQIAARVWTFERDEQIDREFFVRRIVGAKHLRTRLEEAIDVVGANALPLRAYRLVNAESDFLPGVVIDRYGEFLVAQFLTLGAELHKQTIAGVLQEQFGTRGIYERSDVDVRKKEGLQETTGVLWGAEPPGKIEIVENDLRFWVDVKRGHKTGFYLDQRVNRLRAVSYLMGDVLNVFAYTGAFGVYAAKINNATVTNLDASASALELARENFALNGVAENAEFVTADAFEKLREYRGQGRKFDAIVLDPPKFVTSAANLERATRGYKDLNLLAFQLLNPNGFLITFSCSGLVSPDLFQKIVFGASVDAKRDAQIVEKLGQSPDHPIGLHFPEGEYLKGLILRVL
ncbi:MAG: class I SAM-dependent methyltransferase [Chloroflexi bacterium]|nr:class I SAM-dependent methyltransferase [Chloroflexota bacterium]